MQQDFSLPNHSYVKWYYEPITTLPSIPMANQNQLSLNVGKPIGMLYRSHTNSLEFIRDTTIK